MSSQSVLQSYINDFISPHRKAGIRNEWILNVRAGMRILSPFHDYRAYDRLSDPDDIRYDFVYYRCYKHRDCDFVIRREKLFVV
jgi:hypothetical protein